MSMMVWAKQANRRSSKEGFWAWAWRNFLVEVLPFFYDKKTIVWLEKDLLDEIEPIEPRVRVQIQVVDDPDDGLVPSLEKAAEIGWRQSSFVGETLQKGGKCYLAANGSNILAYLWIMTRSVVTKEPHWGMWTTSLSCPKMNFIFSRFSRSPNTVDSVPYQH